MPLHWIALTKRLSNSSALTTPTSFQIYDHGQHDQKPFYTMDYVEGPDLRVYADKLQERPPLERYLRCRGIGQDIAGALPIHS